MPTSYEVENSFDGGTHGVFQSVKNALGVRFDDNIQNGTVKHQFCGGKLFPSSCCRDWVLILAARGFSFAQHVFSVRAIRDLGQGSMLGPKLSKSFDGRISPLFPFDGVLVSYCIMCESNPEPCWAFVSARGVLTFSLVLSIGNVVVFVLFHVDQAIVICVLPDAVCLYCKRVLGCMLVRFVSAYRNAFFFVGVHACVHSMVKYVCSVCIQP